MKLLNKMRFRAQINRWQQALGRFLQLHAYNVPDLLSIGDSLNPRQSMPKTTGEDSPSAVFLELSAAFKTQILLFVLESQFQFNAKFKEKTKDIAATDLRLQPIGWDIWGNAYWIFVDNDFNFVLYQEESNGEILKVCSNFFSIVIFEIVIAF